MLVRSCLFPTVLLGLLGADAPRPDPEPAPAPAPEPAALVVNARVLAFAESKRGERVGNGECTALAFAALRAAGARGPRPGLVWGTELAKLADARPGDVLQFEGAVFAGRSVRGRTIRTWTATFPHHTAIVARVSRSRNTVRLTILHQNAGPENAEESVRKRVQEQTLNLAELREGTVRAFRPVSLEENPGSALPSLPAR